MSADIMARLQNGNNSVPFNKLSPWYRQQLIREAIKQARQKCVCAFKPRPDDQEAETFCAECVAVVNLVDPRKPSRRFAMVMARKDGKVETVEFGPPTNQFGEKIE